MTTVHQVIGAAGAFDAVTEQAGAYRRLFHRWGLGGDVYAALPAHTAPAGFHHLDELGAGDGEALVVHYSGYLPGLLRVLDLPQPKLLVHHNVTPARYFWRTDPYTAMACELGREYLGLFARAVDLTAAVSSYNAGELREEGIQDPRVIPVLLDPERLRPRKASGATRGDGPLVLSVGRLAAHKRPDLVVRAFALYQRHHEPSARLLCAGPPLDPESTARLEALARDVGARNVSFAGALSQPRLNGAYAEARVFLSMSEHEGFCIPLLEALHFGVPPVARPSGGMPEVGGDAVLWDEDTDLATTAELIQLAATDEKLRAELTRRAAARVEALAPERVAESLRTAVDELLELQPGRAILTA